MKSEKLEGRKLLWLILAAALILLAGILPAAFQPETRPAIYDPVKVLAFLRMQVSE